MAGDSCYGCDEAATQMFDLPGSHGTDTYELCNTCAEAEDAELIRHIGGDA